MFARNPGLAQVEGFGRIPTAQRALLDGVPRQTVSLCDTGQDRSLHGWYAADIAGNTLKITYIAQYYNTTRTASGSPATIGGQSRPHELAKRLVAAGHSVNMITSDREAVRSGTRWRETTEDGVKVSWLPLPYSNYMSYVQRLKAFGMFAARSNRRAQLFDADVVYATSGPLTVAIPGALAARKQAIPMVLEVRDLWPEGAIAIGALPGIAHAPARKLEGWAYHNAAAIVAFAPRAIESIASTGYPRDHLHLISNSSDLDLFDIPEQEGTRFREAYDWLGDRPLVVYTGALGRVNNVSYIARLAGLMTDVDPEVRFLVVGDGYEEAKIREAAAIAGVLNRSFFMLPAVRKTEVPAILSAASIAASTVVDNRKLWGDAANKIFDAFAAGRPVLLNHGGWMADIIEEECAGAALPATPNRAAAERLARLLRDPEWVSHARTAARNLAKNRFSRDAAAERLEQVLRDVVREG